VPALGAFEVGAKLIDPRHAPAELRGDQGEMPGPSDHRVCRVGVALPDARACVQMDVGDDTDLVNVRYTGLTKPLQVHAATRIRRIRKLAIKALELDADAMTCSKEHTPSAVTRYLRNI
jgi:hypothetical protein